MSHVDYGCEVSRGFVVLAKAVLCPLVVLEKDYVLANACGGITGLLNSGQSLLALAVVFDLSERRSAI